MTRGEEWNPRPSGQGGCQEEIKDPDVLGGYLEAMSKQELIAEVKRLRSQVVSVLAMAECATTELDNPVLWAHDVLRALREASQ